MPPRNPQILILPPELEYFLSDTVRDQTDAVNYIVIAPFDTKATALQTQGQDDNDNASMPLIRLSTDLVRKIGAKCSVAYRAQTKLSIIQRLYNLKAATLNLPLIPVDNEDGEQRTPVRRNRTNRGGIRGTGDGDANAHPDAAVPAAEPAIPVAGADPQGPPNVSIPPNASPDHRLEYDDLMAEFAAPTKRGRYDSDATVLLLEVNAKVTQQLRDTLTYSSRVALRTQQIRTLATELRHSYGTEARLIRQMAPLKRQGEQMAHRRDTLEDDLAKLQAELDAKRSAAVNDNADEPNVVATMERQLLQQREQIRQHASESTVVESLASLEAELDVNRATIQATHAKLATEEDALQQLLRSSREHGRVTG